jgi:hypothetical protein
MCRPCKLYVPFSPETTNAITLFCEEYASSLRGLAKRFSNSYSGLFKEFAISLLQAM